jgi:hypothetical protein
MFERLFYMVLCIEAEARYRRFSFGDLRIIYPFWLNLLRVPIQNDIICPGDIHRLNLFNIKDYYFVSHHK